MRAAIYARVSTDSQQQRGTIGSQLAVLRARIAQEGDECVAEFCDDGHSGARLDRPGLDQLRDAAEAGLIERVWCLSPDRLARVYAYQVIVLDELARYRVSVTFADAPAWEQDDPQSKLLTQVQGVIAEYERAKIAERYRRGKLFRSRAGEVLAWRTPYGYRRLPRDAAGPARLEIFEPEAEVVRRIFEDTVAGGHSTRAIVRRLATDQVPTPTGRGRIWGTSTIGRLLRNEAYIGRVYFNRTESIPDPRPGHKNKQTPRPQEEWIAITVPAIITDEVFAAAARVSRDNSKWSPRRAEPGQWLLKGLVRCGACDVGTNCHKMRGRNGTWHRYYYCRNHDPIRAGGQDRRCPERNIRSDALDAYVFDQVRAALHRPDTLLIGEQEMAAHTPTPDDELLGAELGRLDRKLTAADDERRRLADLYQVGLVPLPELQRRAADVEHRRRSLAERRGNLADQRRALTRDNQVQRRVAGFAQHVLSVMDHLDFDQKQTLLRLVVEQVRVTGWNVEIRLRIPLDDEPEGTPPLDPSEPNNDNPSPLSSEDRLRSLGGPRRRLLQDPSTPRIDAASGDDQDDQVTNQTPERGQSSIGNGGQFSPGVDIWATVILLVLGASGLALLSGPLLRFLVGREIDDPRLIAGFVAWTAVYAVTNCYSVLLNGLGRLRRQTALAGSAAVLHWPLSLWLGSTMGAAGIILGTVAVILPLGVSNILEVRSVLKEQSVN